AHARVNRLILWRRPAARHEDRTPERRHSTLERRSIRAARIQKTPPPTRRNLAPKSERVRLWRFLDLPAHARSEMPVRRSGDRSSAQCDIRGAVRRRAAGLVVKSCRDIRRSSGAPSYAPHLIVFPNPQFSAYRGNRALNRKGRKMIRKGRKEMPSSVRRRLRNYQFVILFLPPARPPRG